VAHCGERKPASEPSTPHEDAAAKQGELVSTLLVVAHVVSPDTRELHEAVLAGTRAEGITGVTMRYVPALGASASDVLDCAGLLLGTPANIGYMSGALKHFFDQIYYPLLDARPGLPYGLWVHGNSDVAGAVRPITAIAGALGWRPVARPLTVIGKPAAADREAGIELGAVLAATVAPG
jgi:NAD(P)H-dependent FMN reductase